MAALIVFLLLIALVVYGLNRNHRRQSPPRLSGSFDIEDRDAKRVRAEVAVRRPELSLPAPRTAVRPRTRHHLSRA